MSGWSGIRSDGVNPYRTNVTPTTTIISDAPQKVYLRLWVREPVNLSVFTDQEQAQFIELPGQEEATLLLDSKHTVRLVSDCTHCYVAYELTAVLHPSRSVSAGELMISGVGVTFLMLSLWFLLFRTGGNQ